jgi:hypothetical protein
VPVSDEQDAAELLFESVALAPLGVVFPPESVIDSTVQVPIRKSKALRAVAADVSEDVCTPWAARGTSKTAARETQAQSVRRSIGISGSDRGMEVPSSRAGTTLDCSVRRFLARLRRSAGVSCSVVEEVVPLRAHDLQIFQRGSGRKCSVCFSHTQEASTNRVTPEMARNAITLRSHYLRSSSTIVARIRLFRVQ